MLRYDGHKVGVIGLGQTGGSIVRHLAARGAELHLFDTRAEALQPWQGLAGVKRVQSVDLDGDRPPAEIDWWALSPGVPRAKPFIQQALASGREVIGDIELLARHLPAETRVFAITGSNGKTTTTALAGELARTVDPQAQVAGNIGEPVLDQLARHPEARTWVLELSSFQLESTRSLSCEASAVLNVTPNHLDRYPSFFDYAASKARIFHHARRQVLNRDCPWSRAMAMPARARSSFGLDQPMSEQDYGLQQQDGQAWLCRGSEKLFPVKQMRLVGRHHQANALAALALMESLHVPVAALAEVLARFSGMPHRCQSLGEVAGIRLIDDSKATTVEATLAALSGMDAPVHLIAGGDGKGQAFEALARAARQHCRQVYLIGRDAPSIAAALAAEGASHACYPSLEEATRAAFAAARAGEIVLLSPACASWDMFANYIERARVFRATLHALASERGLDGLEACAP